MTKDHDGGAEGCGVIGDSLSGFESFSDDENNEEVDIHKRIEAKKKQKALTNHQLKELVTIKEEDAQLANAKLEEQIASVNQLRLNYQKEIIYLREQIFRKEKLGKEFPEIEVEFFDIGLGLSPELMDILNEKIYQMRSGY